MKINTWGMEWAEYATVIKKRQRAAHERLFGRGSAQAIRERKRKMPGMVTRYIPQGGGVFLVIDMYGRERGYVRREQGYWVAAKPEPLPL